MTTASAIPFRVRCEYDEAELVTWFAIVGRSAGSQAGQGASWTVLVLGFAVALGFTWLAAMAGAVRWEAGALVAVLGLAVFWSGVWAPSWATRRERSRMAARQREIAHNIARQTVVVFASGGVALRSPSGRSFHPYAAFRAVTEESGLLLLWLHEDFDLVPHMAVPLRILDDRQRQAIAAAVERVVPAAAKG